MPTPLPAPSTSRVLLPLLARMPRLHDTAAAAEAEAHQHGFGSDKVADADGGGAGPCNPAADGVCVPGEHGAVSGVDGGERVVPGAERTGRGGGGARESVGGGVGGDEVAC